MSTIPSRPSRHHVGDRASRRMADRVDAAVVVLCRPFPTAASGARHWRCRRRRVERDRGVRRAQNPDRFTTCSNSSRYSSAFRCRRRPRRSRSAGAERVGDGRQRRSSGATRQYVVAKPSAATAAPHPSPSPSRPSAPSRHRCPGPYGVESDQEHWFPARTRPVTERPGRRPRLSSVIRRAGRRR